MNKLFFATIFAACLSVSFLFANNSKVVVVNADNAEYDGTKIILHALSLLIIPLVSFPLTMSL